MKFRIGSKVKIKDRVDGYSFHDYRVGEIATIVRYYRGDNLDWRIQYSNGGFSHVKGVNLELVEKPKRKKKNLVYKVI